MSTYQVNFNKPQDLLHQDKHGMLTDIYGMLTNIECLSKYFINISTKNQQHSYQKYKNNNSKMISNITYFRYNYQPCLYNSK